MPLLALEPSPCRLRNATPQSRIQADEEELPRVSQQRMKQNRHAPRHRSSRLEHLGRRQFGLEDPVPEAAGHAEAVLVVGKVVLQMILLELAPVRGKTAEELAMAKQQKLMARGRTSYGAGNSGSCRRAYSQTRLHRRPQSPHTSCMRRGCARDARMEPPR